MNELRSRVRGTQESATGSEDRRVQRRMTTGTVRLVIALCFLKALVHLLVVNRYGYHGDELYFIECGRHLAFGYVDHPPLIPWIARMADELGGGLLVLRVPAIVAGTGTMLFTAGLVREWGGGFRAQLVTLLCLLVAPAHLRMGAMLNIPVIEVFFCTVATYLVARALRRGERWTWVFAGLALGVAIVAKHTSILWGGALLVGILASEKRRVLGTPWPWLGGALAILLLVPNLAWQFENGFATVEFMRTLRKEVLVEQGRVLFVAGQLLYFHPLAVPVWMSGIVFAFTEPGRFARPFATLFVTMFGFFLVMGGKPYYLASAYPGVLAAGGIALERWLASRPATRRALFVSLTATGVAFGVLSLPWLPLRTLDGAIGRLLGWAVPPMALTHDLHGMYGWDAHVAAVERVYRRLSVKERGAASVLAGNYAQASAINVLGNRVVPRAVSGNMSYYLWGPDRERGDVLIAYGVRRELLERYYRRCEEADVVDAPLARPGDTNLPVYLCRDPVGTMARFWPRVRQFGHLPPTSHAGEE